MFRNKRRDLTVDWPQSPSCQVQTVNCLSSIVQVFVHLNAFYRSHHEVLWQDCQRDTLQWFFNLPAGDFRNTLWHSMEIVTLCSSIQRNEQYLTICRGTAFRSEHICRTRRNIGLLRRKWQSTPVLLAGKSRGQVGYSPWGRKESDTTKWLHFC